MRHAQGQRTRGRPRKYVTAEAAKQRVAALKRARKRPRERERTKNVGTQTIGGSSPEGFGGTEHQSSACQTYHSGDILSPEEAQRFVRRLFDMHPPETWQRDSSPVGAVLTAALPAHTPVARRAAGSKGRNRKRRHLPSVNVRNAKRVRAAALAIHFQNDRAGFFPCPWDNCERIFTAAKSRSGHISKAHRGWPNKAIEDQLSRRKQSRRRRSRRMYLEGHSLAPRERMLAGGIPLGMCARTLAYEPRSHNRQKARGVGPRMPKSGVATAQTAQRSAAEPGPVV